MITLPALDAHILLSRIEAREVAALAEVSSYFAPDEECFTGTPPHPIGRRWGLVTRPDPKTPNWIIIAPVCRRCCRSPDRKTAETTMLTATFGGFVRPVTDKPPAWAAYVTFGPKRRRRP